MSPHGGTVPYTGMRTAGGVAACSPAGPTAQWISVSASEAGGLATAETPLVPSALVAVVRYIALTTSSTSAATCDIYVGDRWVDHAAQVQDASAQYDGLLVPTGQQLQLQFAGLSAGSTVGAHILWALVPAGLAGPVVAGAR